MKTLSELRELFLSFFEEHQHRRVPSHSLIPPADPSLLFVNAGMVQFKDVFVGRKTVDYVRATSSQKCLRVSGKHNDLENVGRTARHHTFFEMLGNFSFGDYFKRDAIAFAYEFLVGRVGLEPETLYYTVFGGDETDGIPPDDEARGIWKQVAGVGDDRVLAFGKKDNFWSMGETGPCGPCSEILVDRGPGPWACGRPECAPGCDCDRFMEVWNLVFMQYERKVAGGALDRLPAPSIDTGMGLERLAAILQKRHTNYETEGFLPMIRRSCELFTEETGRVLEYGGDPEVDVALRVIADHARAAAFLVADGVYPDNEGRGYIPRLLIRRAVRFGRKTGFARSFFSQVCQTVVDEMGAAYPELQEKRAVIAKVVGREEELFSQTFDEGRRKLEEEMDRLRARGESRIPGDVLFLLHDERGFQPDLVELIAGESGFTVDRKGYDDLMLRKKEESGKTSSVLSGDSEMIFRNLLDSHGGTTFLGYTQESGDAKVLAVLSEGKQVQGLSAGGEGLVVLDATPCYGESGGQVGDRGRLQWSTGNGEVQDTTKRPDGIWVHRVLVVDGVLTVGERVVCEVDGVRRSAIRAHHSATHLLHWALESVLGAHIKQEGSVVRDDMLRFDFRHFAALSVDEVSSIEALVNQRVVENSPVDTRELDMDDAMKLGAKAFFDEKYGARVRVVTMGAGVSRELCGGTHAGRTGDIGLMKILRQEAVSAGVRRVYAVCHLSALRWMQDRERQLGGLAETLRCGVEDVAGRVDKLLERVSEQDRNLKELEKKLLAAQSGGTSDAVSTFAVKGETLGVVLLPDGDNVKVRDMADLLRDRIHPGVVLVGGVQDGKLLFVVARTSDSHLPLHCGKIVQEIARVTGARGGGKPDFGQAGGGEPGQWDAAVETFRAQASLE